MTRWAQGIDKIQELLVAGDLQKQFQTHFRTFGTLRRRRNEVEYPTASHSGISVAETAEAHDATAAILDAAAKLLPHLGFF